MSAIAAVRFRSSAFKAPAAILLSTVAIALLLLSNDSLPVGFGVSAVIISFAAWFAVLQEEDRGHPADIRVVATAAGALMLLAIALSPMGSHDVWSYTMYGRMVSHYGVSPYTHVPHDFPHDPFLPLVARGWRNTSSVYGPVFVVFSAIGTALAGGSVVMARLFHQAGAAIAVTAALVLIWRRTHSPAAVMFLGLNPLVIVSVINGGHNDALVGLAVLGAVLLAEERRPVGAAFVLGLAVLIKITALLALPALLAWTLYRFGRRAAGHLAGLSLATVTFGYALAGPGALTALNSNHTLLSRSSPWQVAHSLLGVGTGHPFAGVPRSEWLAVFGLGSIVVVSTVAAAIAWRRRRDSDLGAIVALALTAYLVAGIYVLPWYAMWVLPTACIVRRRATMVYIAALGAFLSLIYLAKDRALPGTVSLGWWWLGAYIGPVVLLAAFGFVAFHPSRATEVAPAPGPLETVS